MVKLSQIQAGELLDLLQTIHQGVAVDEELSGGLGHIQVVLKELVDGEEGLLIQRINGVLLEDFRQENLAQSSGQLVNQAADSQVLIVHDALFRVKEFITQLHNS